MYLDLYWTVIGPNRPITGQYISRMLTEMSLRVPTIHILTYIITKTCLFKYTENFTTKRERKFSDKKSVIFHISAQNRYCGYSLEPPRRGGSKEYPQYMFLSKNKKNNVYPCKPQFYYMKVGFKGVKII